MIFLERLFRKYRGNPEENIAGMLIDMQEHYLKSHTQKRRDTLIYSQKKVIDFLSERGLPIAVLEFVADDGRGPTIQELEEALEGTNYYPVPKEDNSGFTNPDLLKKLQEWNAKHLILMGINSSFCVKYTAKDAIRNGLYISTARDLISDSQPYLRPEKWFRKNCIYFTDTTEELLKKLK